MSKVICFDVDGTLRDNVNHEIKESTLNALKKLKEAGHYLVVSTGRGYDSLKRTQIFDILKWDGYVMNNGQLILDKDQNIIHKYTMNPKSVLKMIEIADSLDMPLTLKMDERIITREPNEYVYETQKYFGNVIPPVGRYNGKDDVYAICLFSYPGYDYEPFKHVEGINIAVGKTTYADGTISTVSKATGNLELAHLFNHDDYIAFGDSQNDLEMFDKATLSICMGDGDEVAKEKADYVTDTIDNDGIEKACLHFNYWRSE